MLSKKLSPAFLLPSIFNIHEIVDICIGILVKDHVKQKNSLFNQVTAIVVV